MDAPPATILFFPNESKIFTFKTALFEISRSFFSNVDQTPLFKVLCIKAQFKKEYIKSLYLVSGKDSFGTKCPLSYGLL